MDLCSALACVEDCGTTNTGDGFLNKIVPQKKVLCSPADQFSKEVAKRNLKESSNLESGVDKQYKRKNTIVDEGDDEEIKESDLEEGGSSEQEISYQAASFVSRPKINGLQPLSTSKGLRLRMLQHKSFRTCKLEEDPHMRKIIEREDEDQVSEASSTLLISTTTAQPPPATHNAKTSK